jgi:ankyrin repeat protein
MVRLLLSPLALLALTVLALADPLVDAVTANDAPAVERLLSSGADINGRARDGATPLIAAALAGQLSTAEFLLAHKADVMARNFGGFTALHAAAYSGDAEMAKLLIGRGAVIDDAANKAGVTPLCVASEEGRLTVVQVLIANGADVGHSEIHGYSPITRAFWRDHKEMVALLKKHGAACQSVDVLGSEESVKQCEGIQ